MAKSYPVEYKGTAFGDPAIAYDPSSANRRKRVADKDLQAAVSSATALREADLATEVVRPQKVQGVLASAEANLAAKSTPAPASYDSRGSVAAAAGANAGVGSVLSILA